ncbi:NADH--cytochrome b5 reductase 1-like [Gossypium australe]|uniref:NADH--cytochrome b5 reductase 1-like n=1 Tax=Gossypium australe TaxID=47621 RepID=A0A5B6X2E2_9ROSI|nr:NADH--cytochrome b5 reductase 1-like [Gossypium australe]
MGLPVTLYALGSIMTWNELAEKFLQKFFPISKTFQLDREITIFKQLELERVFTNLGSVSRC